MKRDQPKFLNIFRPEKIWATAKQNTESVASWLVGLAYSTLWYIYLYASERCCIVQLGALSLQWERTCTPILVLLVR